MATRKSDDILDRFAKASRRTDAIQDQSEPLRRQPYLGYNTSWRVLPLMPGWSTGPVYPGDFALSLRWRCKSDICVLAGRVVAASSATNVLATLPRDVTPPEVVTCWASLIAVSSDVTPPLAMTQLYINPDGTISVKDIPSSSQQLMTFPCSWPLPVEGGGY